MEEDFEKFRFGLTIDRTRLDEELEKQAATYLFVAEKSIEAESQYEMFKLQIAQLKSNLDEKIRLEMDAAKQKITENGVFSAIERDENYRVAQRQLITLHAKVGATKALRESYYMRKDLLIQLAIKSRAEIESFLSETVKSKIAA